MEKRTGAALTAPVCYIILSHKILQHCRTARVPQLPDGLGLDLPELITEFDESLWAGLVDSLTVHSKDRIMFRLTCGKWMEI